MGLYTIVIIYMLEKSEVIMENRRFSNLGIYGELIRKIRLDKCVQQKVLYEGIISKSFSIAFEQGKHDISLSLLEKISGKLNVSIDELQYMSRKFEADDLDKFLLRYSDYGNPQYMNQLSNLLQEYTLGDDTISQIKAALVRSRIDQLNEFLRTGKFKKSTLEQKNQEVILNYLSSINTWTCFEIVLFSNSLDYINYEEKSAYFKLILPYVEKYKSYPKIHSILCELFSNLLFDLIFDIHRKYLKSLINTLMTELEMLSRRHSLGFYKILYCYFEGIIYEINLYEDRSNYKRPRSGESQARFALDMLREIDQSLIADIYESSLNLLMSSL